jgi:hypothetical protein
MTTLRFLLKGDKTMRAIMQTMVIALCFASVAGLDEAAGQDRAADAKAVEGLWSGSWGGGERGGVVFQPVVAEMLIQGDQVELVGFRGANRLVGTIQLDARARRMRITPAHAASGAVKAKASEYAYEIKGDTLTLIDGDKMEILLQRQRVIQNPLADVRVEFVATSGINGEGDLLVTEFTVLRAGRAGADHFKPASQSLKTKQATVLLVQENGLKKITVAEARRLIRDPMLVAVSYRQDDREPMHALHELWTEMGSARPDGDAVGKTFARMLRPGTLIFVLSARENLPVP